MKKTILLGIIIALMAIMSYGVYGAVTCATTCDVNEASKGVPLVCNATLSGATAGDFNATNGTLYLYSSSTDNSSTTTLAVTNNGTDWTNQSDGSPGLTFNVTYIADGGIQDAPDYTGYITLVNATAAGAGGGNILTCSAYGTSIKVDYSKPTIQSLTYDDDSAGTTGNSFTSKETVLGLDDVVYANVGDFTNITSACLLYFNNDIYTITEGTTYASYTLLRGEPSDRFYDYFKVTCTDGTNTTTSTIYNDIEVESIKEGAGTSAIDGYAVDVAQDVVRKRNVTPVVVIIAIVGFLFLANYFKNK